MSRTTARVLGFCGLLIVACTAVMLWPSDWAPAPLLYPAAEPRAPAVAGLPPYGADSAATEN